jgi:CheY-like chemotaxis protein
MDTATKTSRHILLVEDDLRDAELTLAALEEHLLANEIAVVHDGAEALDYLFCRGAFEARNTGDPFVVLLDNKMPKVGGLEVLKAMKADPHLRTIPVVVLTSSRETPDLVDFYRHGVNAYVVKPVDFSEFTEAVKHLGFFWAAINEPPPVVPRNNIGADGGPGAPPANEKVKNEIPAAPPASGG